MYLPKSMYGKIRNSDKVGFITPTDNPGFSGRKKTIDNWSANSTTIEFENEPQSCFKIIDYTERSGRFNHTGTWNIQDPRGFSIEISSNNLLDIIKLSDIVNGEIVGKCVYGRDGSSNVLVDCKSEIYKEYVKATEIKSAKISLRHITPGDTVVFQNSDKKIYIGKFNLIGKSSCKSDKKVLFNQQEVYIFADDENITSCYGLTMYKSSSSIKLSSVESHDDLIVDKIVSLMDKWINNITFDYTNKTDKFYGRCVGYSNLPVNMSMIVRHTNIVPQITLEEPIKQTYSVATSGFYMVLSNQRLSMLRNDGTLFCMYTDRLFDIKINNGYIGQTSFSIFVSGYFYPVNAHSIVNLEDGFECIQNNSRYNVNDFTDFRQSVPITNLLNTKYKTEDEARRKVYELFVLIKDFIVMNYRLINLTIESENKKIILC